MKTILAVLALICEMVAMPELVFAQGSMGGTGLQPSQQLATPPDTPAIDRPGAEERALQKQAQQNAARSARRPAAERGAVQRDTSHEAAGTDQSGMPRQ